METISGNKLGPGAKMCRAGIGIREKREAFISEGRSKNTEGSGPRVTCQ